MNIFKKVRDAKFKSMEFKERVKRYVGPDEEDVKKYQQYKESVTKRKKISDDIYGEKQEINKSKMQLRKRSPTYRVADALKTKIQENKKKNKGFLGGSGEIGNLNIGGSFYKK